MRSITLLDLERSDDWFELFEPDASLHLERTKVEVRPGEKVPIYNLIEQDRRATKRKGQSAPGESSRR